jgi:cyclophilin family peptidyl-prolyl cis-trans isomerase
MRRLLLLFLALIWAGPAHATVLVRFETPLGSFDVELYEDAAPGTVANFLHYVETGRYVNSFVHRNAAIPGIFVVQGGGFTYDAKLGLFVFGQGLRSVPTYAPIASEYALSNTRGTIAMALSGSPANPDSGTSQWFINVTDNSAQLNPQEFTVFGGVVEPGMEVVDDVFALQRWNAGVIHGALSSIPLIGFVQNTPIGPQHLVYTNVTEVPEPAESALRLAALASVLLLARVRIRRPAAGRRP